MNYKNIFNKLSKILSINCAINIILVIDKVRPAFWYDCWDLDRIKINKLLKYLDTFSKNGIRYKFDNETYLKKNMSKDEGPLIYNIETLKPKYIKIIETNNIKNLYNNKIFGEILGYSCPINISRIKKKNYSSIDFIIQYETKQSKYNNKQLYGFFCLTSNIKNIIGNLNKKAEEMNRLLKKINKNYNIILSINY
jgi:hypothetical protein